MFEYQTDDLGPEKIILGHNREFNFHWFVVVDNTIMGFPAKGGTMMAPDLEVELIARKARGMTLKNALAGLPLGGGKSGIVFDPKSPEKEKIIRAFARDVKPFIDAKLYVPGMDVGVNERDIAAMVDELKNPQAATGSRVKYDEVGVTGFGVVKAIESAAKIKNVDLKRATAAIQGFGAVGKAAAKFLAESGVKITAVSDSKTALFGADGLDFEKLLAAKNKGGLDFYPHTSGGVGVYEGAEKIKLGEEIFVDADILCLAAKEDVLTKENAELVKAKIVAEGANMPTTPEAQEILRRKNVLVIPDIVANSGGVIAAYCELKYAEKSDEEIIKKAFELTEKTISKNTEDVLTRALAENKNPKETAIGIAKERLNLA